MSELHLIAEDPSRLGGAFAAATVEAACLRDTAALAAATRNGWIDRVIAVRQAAARVVQLVQQRGMPIEVALLVGEVQRRCERALGVIVRREQAAGRLAKRGDAPAVARAPYKRIYGGKLVTVQPTLSARVSKPSPAQYFNGNDDSSRCYVFADGITDTQFEAVLAAARAERNFSRANVLRLARAVNARPVPVRPAAPPIPPAYAGPIYDLDGAPGAEPTNGQPRPNGGNGRFNPRKEDLIRLEDQRAAITNAVAMVSAVAAVLDRIDALHPDLGAEEAGQWLADLSRSRRALGGITRILKERTNGTAPTED